MAAFLLYLTGFFIKNFGDSLGVFLVVSFNILPGLDFY